MRSEEFERLYEEHAQPLLGFLVYRTGDVHLSEDLLADTFERVLRARARFDPRKASRKTWLYSIALNCLRDRARREQTEAQVLTRSYAPAIARSEPGFVGAAEDSDALRRALATLSPEEHEAVALRYGGDLTAPELARLLGERLTTVEGRLARAMRKLRADLGA